ncbi:MAG: SRPBCC family protein [Phycisphaerales bacterium]|nr:SRPBCC family protein [Phycisphaerales bacterium]MCB9854282.1 SRPBCC family protein [Phycisphaerales bacterium]MCB9863483.1 SRPBCC family protein [Phycisphaerales bacterium]
MLCARLFVDRPIDDVFAFFSDAHNLQRITPPDLDFNILTPAPIDMHAGTLIDYKLRVHGIPIRWRTLINAWEPPYRFVDEQLRGPYRMWHHEHRFETAEGGTNVLDEVTFKPLGGALMTRLFVGRDVKRIFEYRSSILRQLFAE